MAHASQTCVFVRRPFAIRRRGAMLPLVALLLPVILVVASLVINVAYMELTRTELRIASDSATRAAGHTLATTGDQAQSRVAAQDAANRNTVAGRATQIAAGDVVFGVARRSAVNQRYSFSPGGSQVNSVRVNLRRNAGSKSGLVKLIFPSFKAVNSFGPAQLAVSSQVELDVALVLDRSGSMAYGDLEDSYAMAVAGLPPASAPAGWKFGDPAPPGSRWRELVSAVQVFTNALTKSPQLENVGLVTYADGAARDCDLSTSYAQLSTAMGGYTKAFNMGRTNIGDGIVEGLGALNDAKFARPWAVQVVIVLTDGIHNIGTDPQSAARQAFSSGVTVYTVTFSQEADQTRMQSVARDGGGRHFHAATGAELQNVFSVIAGELPTLLIQ